MFPVLSNVVVGPEFDTMLPAFGVYTNVLPKSWKSE